MLILLRELFSSDNYSTMKNVDFKNQLNGKGLRITPQRLVILEAIARLKNHPTAENILDFIKKHHPHIATGTVYKILDVLVEKGLINKVKTDRDIMRYDAILNPHHHLYSSESDQIEDYFDDHLSKLISDYFKTHKIPGFVINDIKLQIIGKFKNQNLK